ncbi:hypothetical protein K523DRAFT_394886 [Schizophyllum commune Tattone D]|nr:hypothetical protein K523DRAFT_394886 [Schizophyllum commune Tattone D]
MDLTLSKSDIMDTVFSDGTGRALYRTHTNHPAVPHETALYRVTLAGLRDHLVVVNGRNVTPVKKKKLSAYWKTNAMGSFTLVDEETKEVIASYERHSALSSQSNKVHIEEKSVACREAGMRTCVTLCPAVSRRDCASLRQLMSYE